MKENQMYGTIHVGADRNTAHNRRLAHWRVKWLIEQSTSHQLLWCSDSFWLMFVRIVKRNRATRNIVRI